MGTPLRHLLDVIVVAADRRVRLKLGDHPGYRSFRGQPIAANAENGVEKCALGDSEIATVGELPHEDPERRQRAAVIATEAHGSFDRALFRLCSGAAGIFMFAHKCCFQGTAIRASVDVLGVCGPVPKSQRAARFYVC